MSLRLSMSMSMSMSIGQDFLEFFSEIYFYLLNPINKFFISLLCRMISKPSSLSLAQQEADILYIYRLISFIPIPQKVLSAYAATLLNCMVLRFHLCIISPTSSIPNFSAIIFITSSGFLSLNFTSL